MKNFEMTRSAAEEHQRRHGFMLPREVITAAAEAPPSSAPAVEAKRRTINKTEAEYGEMLKRQYPSATLRYEAYTLKLADGCRYTPDWAVEFPDGRLEFHEVKGAFIFAKALVKPRTAAELFPQRFVLAQKRQGAWEITPLKGKADQ